MLFALPAELNARVEICLAYRKSLTLFACRLEIFLLFNFAKQNWRITKTYQYYLLTNNISLFLGVIGHNLPHIAIQSYILSSLR